MRKGIAEDPATCERIFVKASNKLRSERRHSEGGESEEELKEAYWKVVMAYAPLLEARAIALAKAKTTTNAHDLGHDAFAEAILRAYKGLATFRSARCHSERPFLSWFARVLHNALVDGWRKSRREHSWSELCDERGPPEPLACTAFSRNLERHMDSTRAVEKLLRCARTEAQQDYTRAFLLVAQGRSWPEASVILKRPGKPDTLRRSAIRWAQSVLVPHRPPKRLPAEKGAAFPAAVKRDDLAAPLGVARDKSPPVRPSSGDAHRASQEGFREKEPVVATGG